MSTTPLVSVIVPTHNREALLRDHLQALRDQAMSDFEAIYVDDGSTDETPRILSQAADAWCGRLKHIRTSGLGPGGARNRGAREARAEWLLFSDDDTVPPTFWIGDMLDKQRQWDTQALSGGFEPYSENTPAERYLHYRMRVRFSLQPYPVAAAPMMNFLVSRQAFEKTGGFQEGPLPAAEDWEFCHRLRQAGYTIQYDPSVSVRHHDQRSWAAAARRIRAAGAMGVYACARFHGSMAAYVAYSVLRGITSPFWTPQYYPLRMYGRAVQMEYLFFLERIRAYWAIRRGVSIEEFLAAAKAERDAERRH